MMASTHEGIGALKLECPQGHPVGTIRKQAAHQAPQYDPGASVGPRRPWPEEDEQGRFKTRCGYCDKIVGDFAATLQNKLGKLIADGFETHGTATLPYL
jgi:hypothetical protein